MASRVGAVGALIIACLLSAYYVLTPSLQSGKMSGNPPFHNLTYYTGKSCGREESIVSINSPSLDMRMSRGKHADSMGSEFSSRSLSAPLDGTPRQKSSLFDSHHRGVE
jgi:hypothetical protein